MFGVERGGENDFSTQTLGPVETLPPRNFQPYVATLHALDH